MSFLHKLREKENIPTGPYVTIKISNVSRYLFEVNSQEVWTVDKDFPNLAPPFTHMFFEWNPPRFINSEGKITPTDYQYDIAGKSVLMTKMGMFVEGVPRSDGGWTLILVGAALVDDEPMLLARSFVSIDVQPDGNVSHERTPDGKLLAQKIGVIAEDVSIAGEVRSVIPSMMNPVLLAISFMHCKNVVIRTHETGVKKARKQGYHETFKTLEIEALQKILNAHGAQHTGIQNALHMCRGHFKTYTADAPLLGRATGTFFWAQQIRGSRSAGVSRKDYGVKLR